MGTPLYFFWCAPPVVLAIVLAEGVNLRIGLRPLASAAAKKRPPAR